MSMGTAWLIIAMLVGVLVLAGCVTSDEGAIDLRRTIQVPIQTEVKRLPLMTKNFHWGLRPGSLQTIRSPFICARRSYILFGRRETRCSGFQRNGEIAIVANAFEMATNRELDFTNTKAGRLVFYSDDVTKDSS